MEAIFEEKLNGEFTGRFVNMPDTATYLWDEGNFEFSITNLAKLAPSFFDFYFANYETRVISLSTFDDRFQ